jgi:hypothetical protein
VAPISTDLEYLLDGPALISSTETGQLRPGYPASKSRSTQTSAGSLPQLPDANPLRHVNMSRDEMADNH